MRMILTQHHEGSDLLFRMSLVDGLNEAVQPTSARFAVYGDDDRVVLAATAATVDETVVSMPVSDTVLLVATGRVTEIMTLEAEATLFDGLKVTGRHPFRVRAMNMIGD